jgi:hypothetical protein
MNDFFKNVTEFLVAAAIQAAAAAVGAFVMISILPLFGEHIDWWPAYAICLLFAFCGWNAHEQFRR